MKKYGQHERRAGALERLLIQKEKFEKKEEKIPKRILKEIKILEEKNKFNETSNPYKLWKKEFYILMPLGVNLVKKSTL